MTSDVALLVDLDSKTPMVPITEDMMEVTGAEGNHHWANPSIEDLRSKMRLAWSMRQEGYEMGRRARELIVNQYTWKHTAQRILERMMDLGVPI